MPCPFCERDIAVSARGYISHHRDSDLNKLCKASGVYYWAAMGQATYLRKRARA